MQLLIRRISGYTGADVLLGVFPTTQGAKDARDAYAERYRTDPLSDPWREQAYKEPGLSEDDLVIQELPEPNTVGEEVFVVSDYANGFGQVARKFDSLHGSNEAAQARAADLDAVQDMFPHYARVQRVRTCVLLTDAPEAQPE